jgi:hypothetical protein
LHLYFYIPQYINYHFCFCDYESGELAPNQKVNLARIGFKALIYGAFAAYLSVTIVGTLFD